MAFVVTDIDDFVKEGGLIGKVVLGGKTAGLLNLQTGVKDSAYINLLTADPTLQAGSCGWNAAGDTTISRRTIQTGQIKVNTPFCDKDLYKTFLSYGTRVAAGQKTMPFAEMFIGQNIMGINNKLEATIWQGDTTLVSDSHLKRFDGFVKIIGSASGVVDATDSSAKDVVAKADEVVATMVANIPDAIIDRSDLAIFCGYDAFRSYVALLQAANLFHYTADLGSEQTLTIPGTGIKLIGVPGLTGVGNMYASYLENMYLGVDMEGDQEKFEWFYSQDNGEYRLRVEFNAGVQVAFPDLVVKYIGA